MASDTSLVVYGCPFCTEFFRDERQARNHVSAKQDAKHARKSGFDMDETLEVLTPSIPEFDFDDWSSRLAEWAEENHDDDGNVVYTEAVDALDLPGSYVVWWLKRQPEYRSVNSGMQAAHREVIRWDGLTDSKQATLITRAYFPDLYQREIAERFDDTHPSQSQVSQTERRYMWMLAHPDVDTPIYPNDNGDGGGGDMTVEGVESYMAEKVADAEDDEDERIPCRNDGCDRTFDEESAMYGHLTSCEYEDDDDTDDATESDDPLVRASQKARGADGTSRREMVEGDASVSTSKGVAFTEPDLTFESIVALIETGRYEEAREMFDRATGAESYDLRWNAPEVDDD